MEPSIIQNQIVMWTVVAVYMVVITLAGGYYSKYMRTADAYFKGNNLIPWWAAGISTYIAHFTAYTFVAIASLVYIDGLSGLLLETGPALVYMTVAVVFARRWHRLNLTSPPEYLEARFNPATRQVFSVLGIVTSFIASGTRLYAMAKMAESLMGLPLIWTIVLMGAVMIVYTVMGGLWAVIVTDVVQFIVLFLGVLPLLAISASRVFLEGSLAEFVARIPAGYASFPNPDHGRTAGWLLAFWFAYLLDVGGDWGTIQRMCCTPTEKDARKAALLAAALSLPHAFLLLGPVFIARVLWSPRIADPNVIGQAEGIYGRVAVKLLPAGMIGVVAAAMFSATMSTLGVAWNVRATSFVNDLYVRFMRPSAGDREQILAGRLAALVIGGISISIAIVVAFKSGGLFALAQDLIGLVVIPLVLPLLFGTVMKRGGRWAAIAGLVVGVAFASLNKFGYALLARATPLPFEYEVIISATLSILAMLATSIPAPGPESEARVKALFARMATPRPPAAADRGVPPPLGVIGAFAILIGLLFLLLVALPQSATDRVVTFAAGAILTGFGALMKRKHRAGEAANTGPSRPSPNRGPS
jgi:SSS family transporter